MFMIRQILATDLDSTYQLAKYLNSYNLPYDLEVLKTLIAQSERSFADPNTPRHQAIYMFVLEDLTTKAVIGTSLIFGKHGSEENPHTYLKVLTKIYEDSPLKIRQEQTILRFEYDTDGPSEIGGLILHPDYRGRPGNLGKHLSFARFLYMGIHLGRFEKETIAELLPPFNEDGTSALWEAYGKRFTGLSYQEADILSRSNKDFIKNLFPQDDIYTCLFNARAQAAIGETGAATKPVKHMLEKIGFRYLEAVDPFDGGPHFGAKTAQITLIKKMREIKLSPQVLTTAGNSSLVGFNGKRGFGCICATHRLENNELQLHAEVIALLKEEETSETLYLMPQI